MTSQQDSDFVKCIQGHCMHPEDPEVCWYERNWREICQTETDHDVINDILSARQDQALTSWKDKECEAERSKVGDLAMEHAKRADYFKPDTLVVVAETLDWASKLPSKSLQSQNGGKQSPSEGLIKLSKELNDD